MDQLAKTTELSFFESRSFHIEQPFLQWNENYKITNDRNESIFARHVFRLVNLIASIGLALIAGFLLASLSFILGTLTNSPLLVGTGLVLSVALGFFVYFKRKAPFTIELYADQARSTLIYSIRRRSTISFGGPQFDFFTSDGTELGSLKKDVTLMFEQWRFTNSKQETIALIKQNLVDQLLPNQIAFIREGSGVLGQFTVTDSSGRTPYCHIHKDVFDIVDNYLISEITDSAIDSRLLVGAVLVLDNTFYVNKALQARKPFFAR